jgi:hypothetical protein
LAVFGMREVEKRVKKGVKWDGLQAPFPRLEHGRC